MASRSRTHPLARVFSAISVSTFVLVLLGPPSDAFAQPGDLEQLRILYSAGKYDQCISKADEFIKANNYGETYRTLKVRAELARGKYAEAARTIEQGIEKYSWSIALRWLGYEAYLHAGNTARAGEMIAEIDKLYAQQSWRFSDAEDLMVLGQVALLVGADPKAVLENFFDRAKKNSPSEKWGYLAAGNMALDKHDQELALSLFSAAANRFPQDADILFGLARSMVDADAESSRKVFDQILTINPQHLPTILLQTDRLISSESYEAAENNIRIALKVNPKSFKAWAFRAVIAHLQGDSKREKQCRDKALATWKDNPEVDHIIGAKLSRSYRFAEGAAYQQQALKFNPKYLPAQIQLSQDLLRLGREAEGWKLAEAAHDADGYDVTTYNLLNLRDEMKRFSTIENDHFILRMSRQEAGIYGDRVLRLLERARASLCEKYELELEGKVTVEIFPDEDDFAVRTFGMPAVSGFLGVCFGNLITANSPASQLDSPNNWEAVLWHEFCHVVTLSLTNNKMPRWLSEGISVYEEKLSNPAWGMEMTPQYREWILNGEMKPVRELTKAFMQPPSPMHMQFAYFQSSLVVEYLVQEHGIDALRNILTDLGNGVLINETLNRRTDSLAELEEGFVKFARQRAEQMAPDVDWSTPDKQVLLDPVAAAEFLKANPNNYIALTTSANTLMQAGEWDAAERTLTRMIELHPEDFAARKRLALVYRQQERPVEELAALESNVALSSDDAAGAERLTALYAEQKNWQGVIRSTDVLFAINPLVKAPWKLRAEAAEALNSADDAIEAWHALLTLEPEDPALVNFKLAKLLHAKGDPKAKRHVLMALEEAPRYREAHRLLLQIVGGAGSEGTPSAATKSDSTKPDEAVPPEPDLPIPGGVGGRPEEPRKPAESKRGAKGAQ